MLRGFIQKFPDWVDNEIYDYKNKLSLRSNIKDYGGKTHYTDSQNSDTTASSGRELYHLHFSLQAASPETFGYNFVYHPVDQTETLFVQRNFSPLYWAHIVPCYTL
jgi:hypothetical protein